MAAFRTERIDDLHPSIPLGERFWPLAKEERREVEALFRDKESASLATC